MYRVEDKFFCSEEEFCLLQARLGAVLKSDANHDGSYQITSVYFDDWTDTHLWNTIDGSREREKYRIRIYNDSFDTIRLEVKQKKDNRVLKRARKISREQMIDLLEGRCIEDTENSLDSPITLFNLAIKIRVLRPKIIVEYDRQAYVFDPGNVRITLDRNLRASEQIEAFMSGEEVQYDFVDGIDSILEVKYDEFLPGFIAQLLESGNMVQTSYSKYRICRGMGE